MPACRHVLLQPRSVPRSCGDRPRGQAGPLPGLAVCETEGTQEAVPTSGGAGSWRARPWDAVSTSETPSACGEAAVCGTLLTVLGGVSLPDQQEGDAGLGQGCHGQGHRCPGSSSGNTRPGEYHCPVSEAEAGPGRTPRVERTQGTRSTEVWVLRAWRSHPVIPSAGDRAPGNVLRGQVPRTPVF